MIEFKENALIITVENTDEQYYVRMLDTLIWVIGRMLQEQEVYTDLHTLAWLASNMLPSEDNLKARCKKF